jgi:hypothetical protein
MVRQSQNTEISLLHFVPSGGGHIPEVFGFFGGDFGEFLVSLSLGTSEIGAISTNRWVCLLLLQQCLSYDI